MSSYGLYDLTHVGGDFIKDFNHHASFRLDNVKFLKSISIKRVQVYTVLAKHYKLYFFFYKEMCIFYTNCNCSIVLFIQCTHLFSLQNCAVF